MRPRTLIPLALSLVALAASPTVALGAGHAVERTRPAACGSARVDVSAHTLRTARAATLCLVNRERSSRGLAPLRLHPELSRAAVAHARDMVRRGFFRHDTPNGRSPFQRMLATRYVPRGARWLLGENLGWGTRELAQPAALVRSWMRSPSHRRNILNGRFREIGVGIALGVPVDNPRLADQPGATYATDFGAVS